MKKEVIYIEKNIHNSSTGQQTCEITLKNNQNTLLFSEDDSFQILVQDGK